MTVEKFRAAVADCGCRIHLVVQAGNKTIVLKDGADVEILTSRFDVEVERFKSMGCTTMYTDVFLKVVPAGIRRLVELPTGHVVPI